MGYYDDHDQPNRHNRKRRGILIPLLLGVIIGILLVVVALPAVLNSNLVKDDARGLIDVKQSNRKIGNNQVNIDVTSQVTNIIADVSPAVVGVTSIAGSGDFWNKSDQGEIGSGSGVIYKKSDGYAYAVTNHHVINGADSIEIVLSDDTRLEATVLGSDLFSDLAVLRMDGSKVKKPIELGSSTEIKVGEPAIAIGNPLGLMFSGSVTQGVISGKERTVPQDFNQDGRPDWQAEVIQTDAAINPGNSGGALINIAGQLIGINSMKINQAAVEGIGFAIPIDTAIPIINELEQTGEVKRPFFGVEAYSLEEVPKTEWGSTLKLPQQVDGGVYIWSVDPNSPAEKVGIKRLDVITEFDGKQIENMIDLRKILYQEKKIGDKVAMTIYRNGEKRQIEVTLGMQR